MTQRDRDRLVVLKKARKKLIKQSQAAKELGLSARQVRRLLRGLKEKGDDAVIRPLIVCYTGSRRLPKRRSESVPRTST
jgi:DNA-binding Lrp family transcriptional regulator